MAGETLIDISADSAEDFMDQVADKVGEREGDGVMGITNYEINSNYTLDKDGNIAKIKFEVKVTIKRAHSSGGKPDANNKKAIQTAEALDKKHEEKHEKLANDIRAREFAKAEKALEGKSPDDVQDAIDAIKKKVDDAYEDLDDKEGKTEVTEKADGSFTVKQVGR